MSTNRNRKKKPKKRPMRLWLVRDEDPCAPIGGELWLIRSRSEPWLYWDPFGSCWFPRGGESLPEHYAPLFISLAPGECVELREVR